MTNHPNRNRRTKLADVTTIPAYAVIIRATWERGETQAEALAELKRRGLWLAEDQRRQAGLPPWRDHRAEDDQ